MTLATLKSFASRKLIIAAVAATGFLPLAAQAHDRDRIDLNFGRGDFRVDLDFGHDRAAPPVCVQPVTTERVWVEPVYQTVTDRVWVEPVYQTVCDHVWVAPVTQDVCQHVRVGPTYEDRDVVTYTRHGREVIRQHVLVAPGHWEDQHQAVTVTPGHYEDVNRQVLVTPGHWDNCDRQVVVAPGHYEDRQVAVAVAPPWRR